MNNKIDLEALTKWIEAIKEAAKDDYAFSVDWFKDTEDDKFAIVAGWQKMFDSDYSDLFCCSSSQPEYVMCIKIAKNEEQLYLDFESMSMPTDSNGNVDDTCIPLEWDDPAELVAPFFYMEWERIMKEYGEED